MFSLRPCRKIKGCMNPPLHMNYPNTKMRLCISCRNRVSWRLFCDFNIGFWQNFFCWRKTLWSSIRKDAWVCSAALPCGFSFCSPWSNIKLTLSLLAREIPNAFLYYLSSPKLRHSHVHRYASYWTAVTVVNHGLEIPNK